MGFNINNGFYLLLLPIMVIAVFLVYFKFNKGVKRYFFLATRIIIITLLVLSISNISVKKDVDSITTIFSVDRSSSTTNNDKVITDYINSSIQNKNDNNYYGVISFAENIGVDIRPTKEGNFKGFNSVVNEKYTNISLGLNIASSIIPDDTNKRIVLISDGIENVDSALQTTKNLKESGVVVDVFQLDNIIEDEVQISSLKIPSKINKDFKYEIEVDIYSLKSSTTKLFIYKNNKTIVNQELKLLKGQNKFVFYDKTDIGGEQIYKAEIQPDVDTFIENNIYHGYAYVDDMPNILIVSKNGSGDEIIRMLENSSVNVTESSPETLPNSIDKLTKYNGIILADINMDDMAEGFADTLEAYVKNVGGGLLVTGGENSYGMGGYADTTLEKILPVDMKLKDKNNIDDVGMVIVLDRSGSMSAGNYGISKLEMAKEAIMRSIEVLNPDDSIGVLAFDDEFNWVIDMQKVGSDITSLQNKVAGISLGGGTSILPSLKEGYEKLQTYDSKVKHIILLTDGQAEQTGYDVLLKTMNDNNITLSTIAVGSDSDTKLLQDLAERGHGRFYYTDEFTDLPKIFTKETNLAGKNYINNISFYPKYIQSSPIITTELDSLPKLDGYISTFPKDRGNLILASETDEPILSTWQYGLGRAVAWTSDINNIWTSEWLSTENGVDIIKNMVSWILKKQVFLDLDIELVQNGEKNEVVLTFPNSKEVLGINGSAIDLDNNKIDINFKSSNIGEYRTQLPENKSNGYVINLEINNGDEVNSMTVGMAVPYSKEYDIREFNKGNNLLTKLAEETGGRVLKDLNDIFILPDNKATNQYDLTNIFLIVAIIIFIIDIFIRKYNYLFPKLLKFVNISNVNTKKIQLGNTKINTLKKVQDKVIVKEDINIVRKDTNAELLNRLKNRKGE